jgi:hypothetical protein
MVTNGFVKKGSVLDLLTLREIQDECFCFQSLQGGKQNQREYGAVLSVEPIGFALMAEREQEAVLEGFRELLQRIAVHEQLSIHVRVVPYDLKPYLTKLQETRKDMITTVQEMSLDHEHFLLDLASHHAILQRQFFIRIINVPDPTKKLTQAERFELAKNDLNIRCMALLEDIARCGLSGQRLIDSELANYFLSCVNTHYGLHFPLEQINLQAIDRPIRGVLKKEMRNALNGVASSEEEIQPLQHTENIDSIQTMQAIPLIKDVKQQYRFSSLFSKLRKLHGDKGIFQTKEGEPVSHSTIIELLEPALITQNVDFIKLQRHETEYIRGRAIVGYPAYVEAGWLDRLIQVDEPFIDILLYIETLDPKKYTEGLTKQLTGYRATLTIDQRAGRTENPYIESAKEEVEDLRNRIVKQEERVHAVSLYICMRGSSVQELKQRDEKIMSLLRSLDLESVETSMEHLQMWLACLPAAKDTLKRRKVLDTSSLMTAFPFGSTTLMTEPGALAGMTPDGSLVIVDPFSPQLENANETKFAKSGAGKSFDEKVRLARYLQIGYQVIIIDPEDEYTELQERFGGVKVQLSAGNLSLNPFYIAPSDNPERDILEEKIHSLLVLFDLLLADKSTEVLSQREKAYIEAVCRHAYFEAGIKGDPRTHDKIPPTMLAFYTYMRKGSAGPDVSNLRERLRRFVPAFPKHTDTELLKNKLVVFNIRDIPDELRAVSLFMITDYVWTQVRRERHPQPRLLSIDEAWSLLQHKEGGRSLAAIARRARKYNLGVRVTTQMVEDFINNEYGQAILFNSNKFVMKTDPANIDAVSNALKLTEGERKFLLGARKGEGLYFLGKSTGQAHVPLRVIASETEYAIANSNAQELREQAQLLEKQNLLDHTAEDGGTSLENENTSSVR